MDGHASAGDHGNYLARGNRIANGLDLKGSNKVIAFFRNPSSWSTLEIAGTSFLADISESITALSRIARPEASAESTAEDWHRAESSSRGVCFAFDEVDDTRGIFEGRFALGASIRDG